jgi:hypothetical protein
MWDLYLGTGHSDLRRMGAGWPFPGAILLPRNVLERRCDPASRWRHPAITGRDQHLILICQEGFQSSLAAAPWQRPGLAHATNLDGGFGAWAAAGLPAGRALDEAKLAAASASDCSEPRLKPVPSPCRHPAPSTLHHILIVRARYSRPGGRRCSHTERRFAHVLMLWSVTDYGRELPSGGRGRQTAEFQYSSVT